MNKTSVINPYEKRATMRAKRKNNATIRRYPLLAKTGAINDWLTTPEAEAKKLDQMAANMEEAQEARYLLHQQFMRQASALRRVAIHLFPPEQIVEGDAFLEKWYSGRTEGNAFADYWGRKIKDYIKPPRDYSWKEIAEFFNRCDIRDGKF